MFCKLFFSNGGNDREFEFLDKQISEISEPFQIITNNFPLHEFFRKKQKKSQILVDVVPDDGPIANEVYKNSKKLQQIYINLFSKVNYNDIEVFKCFDFSFLRQLNILSKSKRILEEKKSTIFVFNRFYEIFFVILQLSKELGYDTKIKIGYFNEKKIEYLTPNNDNILPNYKNQFSRKRFANFIETVGSGRKSSAELKIKSITKIGSFIIKLILYKFTSKLREESIEKIISKVDNKLRLDNQPHTVCFATTSRVDIYLKPWYPVMENFLSEKKKFTVVTSDLATSLVLTKERIPHIDLFGEVNLLETIFRHSTEGKELTEKVGRIISENKSVLGMSNLSGYFLKQIFRSIALIIICEHIIKKLRTQSIVVAADGEMLENIAILIGKKNNIPSFAISVPGIVPQPLLSDWFHAEKIFVNGIENIDTLTALGYDKKRLILTGNPRYDYLKNVNKEQSKKIIEEKLGINRYQKLVVLAMSRWHTDDEIWFSKLIKFCNSNNYAIIVKIHPVYSQKIVKRLSEEKIKKINTKCKGLKFTISHDFDLSVLFSGADIVVTEFSNAGLEAILLEKPLLTVNFPQENFEYFTRYHEFGAALYFEDYSKFENAIYEILENGKWLDKLNVGRKKYSERLNYYNDGKACKRIFEFLIDPIKSINH